MMRPWQMIVLTAIVIAGLASAVASHEAYEPKLVRLEAQEALPELAPTLEQESSEINVLFLGYASDRALWMSAYLALTRHGDVAREVLTDFGHVPEFQRVLVRYGADAVLPISYFRDNDIATLSAQHWFGERYRQVSRWWGDEAEAASGELTPIAAARWVLHCWMKMVTRCSISLW